MNRQKTPTTPPPINSSEEFERAFQELGRAFMVYWTWKATGLLDGESSESSGDQTPPS